MTRENKLALVIGFGLLLFVGILISDHFSVARSQLAANLRPTDDPLNRIRDEDARLLEVHRPAVVPATMDASSAAGMSRGGEETLSPVPRGEVSRAQMPDLQGDVPLVDLSAGVITSTPSSETIHLVNRGESLTAICRTYFGDASLVKNLASYNQLESPDKVREGQRLRIPHAEMLGGGSPAIVRAPALTAAAPNARAATAQPPGRRAESDKTYVVRDGDILSDIARKTMGSGRKWHVLYKYNEDVIDDPDRLVVGTKLRIPSR